MSDLREVIARVEMRMCNTFDASRNPQVVCESRIARGDFDALRAHIAALESELKREASLCQSWHDNAVDTMKMLMDANEAVAQARSRAEEMREALVYARPIVARWCHTQGDNKQFHAETLAPIDAALEPSND